MFVLATDRLYIVEVPEMSSTLVMTWTGCARWSEQYGCEEFLMEDSDGVQVAVPKFILQDAKSVQM